MLSRAARHRPSPAMVVALLALIAACTGTVVAATDGGTTRLVDRRIDRALDLSSKALTQPQSLTNNADFANVGTLTVRGPASRYMVTAFAQIDTSGCTGPATATTRITFDGRTFPSYPDMTVTVPQNVLAPVGVGGLINPGSYGPKGDPYGGGKAHSIALLAKTTGGINQPQGCADVAARNINAVRLSK